MNLCYNGKLQSMPPRFRANERDIDVIRPLIHCAEDDIALYAQEVGFPIIPCNLCGSLPGGTRKQVRGWIEEMEKERPELRRTMMAALKHVSATHLHDRELAALAEGLREDRGDSDESANAPTHGGCGV